MKYTLVLLLLWLSTTVQAQPESIDLFTFTPPAGWQRTQGQGQVTFSIADNTTGAFGVIGVYNARAASGTPDNEFATEWADLVTRPFGAALPTEISHSENGGWSARAASSEFQYNNVATAVTLVSYQGNQQVQSIVMMNHSDQYAEVISNFLKQLAIAAPASNAAPTPAADPAATSAALSNLAGTVAEISFTVPDGWTRKNLGDRVVLQSPILECSETSTFIITIFNYLPGSGKLQDQASQVFRTLYGGDGVDKVMKKGTLDNGLEFYLYESEAMQVGGQFVFPRAFLIRLPGSRSALITLESNRTEYREYANSINCKAVAGVWKKFISGMAFKGVTPTEATAVPSDLLGMWDSYVTLGVTYFGTTASRLLEKYTFLDGNRWYSEKMFASNQQGSFTIKGSQLNLRMPDGQTVSYRFRLESIFQYGSWRRKLYLYDANGRESDLTWQGE